MAYERELKVLRSAIEKAFNKFGDANFSINQKAPFDLVTDVDLKMEKSISADILKEFPTDKILGEEFSGDLLPSGRTWTIDPIDGTINFAHASKHYGVQCALFDGEEVVVSIIYLPESDEWFTAEKGKGAYLNGKKITVSKVSEEKAIFSFGDFSRKHVDYAQKQSRAVDRLYKRILRVRMFGASSIDYAFLACGRTHGMMLVTKNLWDLAPGMLLVKEAGGVVKSIYGKEFKVGDCGVVAAATEQLVDVLLTAIND